MEIRGFTNTFGRPSCIFFIQKKVLHLNEIIDKWLHNNCVHHRFSKSDATESMILYEQVRIPLYKTNGMAQDTYGFARDLARFLGAAPYNIPVKTVNRGLGRCLLVFGEK